MDARPLILLVEDEDGIRSLISTLLRFSGFDVLGCGDGEEALEIAKAQGMRIRLVLTDVNLGWNRSGLDLAHDLRILLPSIPILYISGREDEAEVIREVDEGRASFLAKPFTPKSLTGMVSALVYEPARVAPAEQPALPAGVMRC